MAVDYGDDEDEGEEDNATGNGAIDDADATTGDQDFNVYTDADVDKVVAEVKRQMTQRFVLAYHLGGVVQPSLRRAWASNPEHKFFDHDTGLVDLDADLDKIVTAAHLATLDAAAYDGRDVTAATTATARGDRTAMTAAASGRPPKVSFTATVGTERGGGGTGRGGGGGASYDAPDRKRGRPDRRPQGGGAGGGSSAKGGGTDASKAARALPEVCWHCDAVAGQKEPKPVSQRAGHNTRHCPLLSVCATCNLKHTPGYCPKNKAPPKGAFK